MKQRNPRFGCPRIAQQINLAFGTDIDKDVVRRVLEKYYHPSVERLICTVMRECLDHTLFWNTGDLERKLEVFQNYYIDSRAHTSLNGYALVNTGTKSKNKTVIPGHYYC